MQYFHTFTPSILSQISFFSFKKICKFPFFLLKKNGKNLKIPGFPRFFGQKTANPRFSQDFGLKTANPRFSQDSGHPIRVMQKHVGSSKRFHGDEVRRSVSRRTHAVFACARTRVRTVGFVTKCVPPYFDGVA